MLTFAIFVPLLGAIALAVTSGGSARRLRIFAIAIAAVPLLLLLQVHAGFDLQGPQFQAVTDLAWIPSVGAGYRVGVDGLGLAMAALSALLFVVAIAYPVDHRDRSHAYFAWLLFLEATCLGLFLALDLLLFYVFFDLSLVGMYFLIGIWGHERRQHAAIQFILFTFAGSLVMLLGILSLALAAEPMTFDMRVLAETEPLAGSGLRGGLTLLALLFGLGVKTPVVPLHTWLPSAHVEAPAPVSAILAGVLLKMGTFGMIRIPLAIMPGTFADYALALAIVALVGIVYGSLVALGQRHIKRRIAYTSITHMGYTVLGIAIAALAGGDVAARRLALDGATLEMIAHGLITGALFLLAGSIWRRGESWDLDGYGGLAGRTPRLAVALVVASLASLGLPGLVGFVAEFQIFSGAVALRPWLAGVALVGVLVTAALFLQLVQALLLGPASPRARAFEDLEKREWIPILVLLGLAFALGVAPAPLLDVLDATARAVVG